MDTTKWESGVKVGDTVEVRWTNNFTAWRRLGRVVKLNAKSVRVELLEAIGGSYPLGHVISVPLILNALWTPRNCIAPADVAK